MNHFFHKKIYLTPNLNSYDKAKKEFLNQKISNYQSFTDTEQKWKKLIDCFVESIEAKHQPNPEFKDFLMRFKTERLSVSKNNQYSLSVQQCINYFEDFLFLYLNEEKIYQLDDKKKKSLLTSIYAIGQVCETGVNGRCYTALHQHQKSNDWLANVLVEARCNHIHLLQAEYESKNTTSDNMSIHVYDFFVNLANQNGFGIPEKEKIKDVHSGLLNQTKMTEFFNQHFSKHRRQFEREIPDFLLNDTLQSLNALVRTEENQPTWEVSDPLKLSLGEESNFYTKLTEFLQSRFDLNDQEADQLANELGELSDSYEYFKLKSQQDVEICIIKAIDRYLKKRQYLLSLNDLENPELQKEMALPKGVDCQAVIELFRAIDANNQDIIQKHINIMHHFIDSLIRSVISTPTQYQFVPLWLKNDSGFIDSMLLQIESVLLEKISGTNEERISELFNLIHQVTNGDKRYLKKIHSVIQNHKHVENLFSAVDGNQLRDDQMSFLDLERTLKSSSLKDIMSRPSNSPFVKKNLQALEKFLKELQTAIPNSEQMDDVELKREACAIENFQFLKHNYVHKTAVTFLAKNENMLKAFVEYQLYQNSMEKVLSIIYQMLHNFVNLIKESTKASIYLILFIKVVPVISYYITIFIWPLLIGFILSGLLTYLSNNRYLGTLFYILGKIITFDYELYTLLGWKFLQCFYQVLNHLLLLMGSLFKILQIAVHCLIHNIVYQEDTLDNVCAYTILRLENINVPSASKKAQILKDLYEQILKDDEQNKSLLLTKPYTVQLHDETCQLSFESVARMRRASKSEFSPKTHDFFSFLRRPTSSSQILNALRI